MTDKKAPKRGRKRRSAEVIDVAPKDDAEAEAEAEKEGEKEEEGDGEDKEPEAELGDAAYAEAAAQVIDVGDEDLPPAVDAGERVSLIKRDPLQAYMQEARRFPLLTPEEEKALATRLFEHGDTVAARKLVEANLRLVVKIAYEYRRAHKNLLDLVQEGNIGLIQAVRKFDPYRGVKLSSYAAFWIRAYILKFILNNWRLVKIGTTQAQRKLFFNLRKEKERLERLGFQPTSALLAENLQVTEKEVEEMEKRMAAPEASLDAPVSSEDDGSRTRLDYLPSDEGRPDQVVEQSEFSSLLKDKLETFAKTLEGREQTIFRERWLTDTPKTLQEIGDAYGVSRERARQLEKRLLGRLRKYLEAELGTTVDIDALSRE
jgi:RNA polymerase sigma-32 factor